MRIWIPRISPVRIYPSYRPPNHFAFTNLGPDHFSKKNKQPCSTPFIPYPTWCTAEIFDISGDGINQVSNEKNPGYLGYNRG